MRGTIDKRLGKRGPAYLVRVDLGPDPVTGKRRQRAKTYPTRKEAETALTQWLAEIERGTAIEPSRLTVREYLEHWLEAYGRHNLRPTTHEGYARLIRVHMVPALGGLLLQKLQPMHLQSFYADKLKAGRADGKEGGLSPSSVRYLHAILREALQQAVKWQLVTRNVADATEPPRIARPRTKTWSVEEARKFLTVAADDGYGPIWLMALTTGMRRGELLALRWADVDLNTGTARVCRALVEVDNRITFQEPKTASGRRTVALSGECVAALKTHRAEQLERLMPQDTTWREHDLVFASATGGPISPHNLVRRFRQLIAKAGVPVICFHALRHTHATLLLRQGVAAKIVSERLGHATIGITLDTYTHVQPDLQRRAADEIDAALFERRQPA